MNLYFLLFLFYLIAPKIDLPFAFPVRPEDIISLIAAGMFVVLPRQKPLNISLPIKLYLAFVAANLFSALVNMGSFGLTGIIYSVRLLQYLVWYFILYEACYQVPWWTMRRAFLLVSAVFIGWGALEFAGVVGVIGKFTGATERLTINTSGPFETSVMLAMLAYGVSSYLMAGPLLVLVFLTQSRVTLVGMVFSYFSSRPMRGVVAAALVFLLYSAVVQPIMNSIQDTRIGKSEGPERMVNAFIVSWQRAPVLDDPTFFRERLLDGDTIFRYMVDTKGDLSFRYRAVRWPTLIKTTLNNPLATVVGWSPGSWGNALDNYYVRVFGETGLLGLTLFLIWLIMTILRLDPRGLARYSLVMMAVVALFIDIFTSSKCMPLLWAFLALEEARHPFAIPQKSRFGLRLKRPRVALPAPESLPA